MVEMLCAVVVLLLASLAMVTEISFAGKSYKESMDVSQGQTLCSTLTTAISEELRGAVQISASPVKFTSQNYGVDCAFASDEDGQITLGGTKLLSPAAYPGGLTAGISSIDYSEGLFSVSVEVRAASGTIVATNSFSVKPLAN